MWGIRNEENVSILVAMFALVLQMLLPRSFAISVLSNEFIFSVWFGLEFEVNTRGISKQFKSLDLKSPALLVFLFWDIYAC